MDKAGTGEPDADESGDELGETNTVGRLEYVEVLQYVRDGHQAKCTSEPQTCRVYRFNPLSRSANTFPPLRKQ